MQRPSRVPAPPELGRLGLGLSWLAGTQDTWPARRPHRVQHVVVDAGEGLVAGLAEADAMADEGVDLVTIEAAGDPVAALTVLCALLDLEPVLALGTASDAEWATRLVGVRDGLRTLRQHVGDPERLVGDPVIGRLTGLLVGCARRRTGVVLGDSVLVAAAALAGERMAPGARLWWLAGTDPAARAARLAHADLALEPLLELGLTVPGGARLASDLLLSALELHAD